MGFWRSLWHASQHRQKPGATQCVVMSFEFCSLAPKPSAGNVRVHSQHCHCGPLCLRIVLRASYAATRFLYSSAAASILLSLSGQCPFGFSSCLPVTVVFSSEQRWLLWFARVALLAVCSTRGQGPFGDAVCVANFCRRNSRRQYGPGGAPPANSSEENARRSSRPMNVIHWTKTRKRRGVSLTGFLKDQEM